MRGPREPAQLAALPELRRRSRKVARLLRRPEYRRGLRHRVAATIEHEVVPFSQDFASVIDVGAHRGQFALFAAVRFPAAHLYCVEPQDDARSRLQAVVPRHRLTTFPYAVGEREGIASFYITSRTDSSSLRPPTAMAKEAFVGVEAEMTRRVEVRRLDDLLVGGAVPVPPVLLKLDVQGAEYEALTGATRLLANVHTVFVEVSFRELYEGQRLAGDVVHLLTEHDLRWCGIYSVSKDRSQRCLQADLVFERNQP